MKAYSNLSELLIRIGGVLRVSKRGVPHIVLDKNGIRYSVAYFKKGDFYKIFFPYPAERQTRIEMTNVEDVVNYFK